MCKPKTPRMPAIPPPRAASQLPSRAGISSDVLRRMQSQYAGRSQIPNFDRPVLTAKLGGDAVVLGG